MNHCPCFCFPILYKNNESNMTYHILIFFFSQAYMLEFIPNKLKEQFLMSALLLKLSHMYFVVVSVIDRLGIYGGREKNILKVKS